MTTNRTQLDSRSITVNPYADVNWTEVTQCLSQFHLHEPRNRIDHHSERHDPPPGEDTENAERSTPGELIDKYQHTGYGALAITEHEYYVDGTKHKGEPFFDGLDVTSWPWSRWDRDGDASEIIPIQGAELRGTIDGVDRLHDIVNLGTDLGHGRERSLQEVATEIGKRDGVSFLPHPGKYFDPDSVESYVELLQQVDSLLGIEVFNAHDRYPDCRAIWDVLLTEFGAQRPVWAVANDDYHARPRPAGTERFDQSRTVLLLEDRSQSSVIEALQQGHSYVQHNSEGTAPRIESVGVDNDVIRLEAPSASTISWISDGETVDTGSEITIPEVPNQYVRAEATGRDGAVSCTQPLYFD
jgi:hypothetical protein